MIKLSKRLAAVAAFASEGRRVADIGTDHGYIPVWLAQQGRAEYLAASDIGEGPLAAAVASAREYGVESEIDFICADGLKGLTTPCDTVILAGMGGDTMVAILSAPEAAWVRKGVHLVLQPQTKTEVLIEWLCENGMEVKTARLIKDAGRLYLILSVLTGARFPARAGVLERVALPPLLRDRDPLLSEYVAGLTAKLRRSLEGLSLAQKKDPAREEELRALLEALSELEI